MTRRSQGIPCRRDGHGRWARIGVPVGVAEGLSRDPRLAALDGPDCEADPTLYSPQVEPDQVFLAGVADSGQVPSSGAGTVELDNDGQLRGLATPDPVQVVLVIVARVGPTVLR